MTAATTTNYIVAELGRAIDHETALIIENANLRAENAQLKADLFSALNHQAFRCRSRRGVEMDLVNTAVVVKAAVALDLDNMHGYNNLYGHAGMDARIAALHDALNVRIEDGIIGGQIGGGDEFAWTFATMEEAVGFAARAQAALKGNGISGTMAVAYCGEGSLNDIVKPAFDIIEQAKRAGMRGVTHTTMPTVSFGRKIMNALKELVGIRI